MTKTSLLCALPLFAACASETYVATEAKAGALTRCVDVSGGEELVSFDVLNARLAANPWLGSQAGIAQVTSCADAHALVAAQNRTLEAGPVDDPASFDTAPAGTEWTPYVKGGTDAASHRGIVALHDASGDFFCSGWLLNEHVLVTAAHCLPGLSGTASFTVGYFDPAVGKERDLTSSPETLHYRRHPGWSGVRGDAAQDLGIIVRKSKVWDSTQENDYLRLFKDTLSDINTVRMWGAGYDTFSGKGLGDLEWADREIDWYGAEHYIMIGGPEVRMCKGDSGGPSIRTLDGIETVTGIHSSMEVSELGKKCAMKGGKMRDTRWTDSNLGWLREAIGDVFGTGPVSCTKLTADGHYYYYCP
jgi:hypothetical protein